MELALILSQDPATVGPNRIVAGDCCWAQNDAFGGGHDLGHNLIFNSCESPDTIARVSLTPAAAAQVARAAT